MTTGSTTKNISAEFTLPDRYTTNRSGPIRWILSHFGRYWYIGVLVMVGAFGNAYLAAVVPLEIGKAFDAITADPPKIDLLTGFVWTIAWTQLVRGVLQFGRNFSAEWLGQLFERNIRDELYASLLAKSMTFHNLQPVGDTMARATNDVREINFMFNPGLNLVVGSAYFIFLPIMMSPNIHPNLILTPLVFLVLYFLLIWQYLHELNPVSKWVREAFGKLNTRLAEAIDGIETVKGMAQEKSEIEMFESNAQEFRDASVRQGDIEARYIPYLLLGVATAAGLFHSLILFKQGEITSGDVIAYFGLLQLFGFPTFASLFAYSQVSLGVAGARRILDLINKETDLDQNEAGTINPIKGEVEFKNVSYAYEDDDEEAISNISFTVKPGQTVAIVGQTGTGKTSLVKLINRTYDVDEGQVLVDGVDVREWQLESLRQQVSIIEQDIFLFSRKIKDNIAFGNPRATQEEIVAAAQAAQAHEFILEFNDGYETVIGERGVTLSGGQRQRLALARAFLTDPQILVLDDSTSAIDSATEDKIQQAIYAAAKGRTTFIITHRLSQIRWADLIVVMRKGKVAAIGTHEQLLESSEAYRRIFND
ncbi:MAG TPA: ABC transporter ATP-binding protein [Anaerolineales bacterium]|nr:ABC transporter ATP-binding protein [Anaerolineales bacterium]